MSGHLLYLFFCSYSVEPDLPWLMLLLSKFNKLFNTFGYSNYTCSGMESSRGMPVA